MYYVKILRDKFLMARFMQNRVSDKNDNFNRPVIF